MLKVYVSRLDRSNILFSTKLRRRSRERRGGSLCVVPCDISVGANPCDTMRDSRKCCFSTGRSVCLGKQGPKFLTERWVYNGPGAGSANQRVHKASCAGGRRELNELQQEDADGKLEVMEGLQMTHIADEMQSNEGVAELTIVTKRGGQAKHPEAEEEKRHLGRDKLGSFDGDLREIVNSLDMSSKDGGTSCNDFWAFVHELMRASEGEEGEQKSWPIWLVTFSKLQLFNLATDIKVLVEKHVRIHVEWLAKRQDLFNQKFLDPDVKAH